MRAEGRRSPSGALSRRAPSPLEPLSARRAGQRHRAELNPTPSPARSLSLSLSNRPHFGVQGNKHSLSQPPLFIWAPPTRPWHRAPVRERPWAGLAAASRPVAAYRANQGKAVPLCYSNTYEQTWGCLGWLERSREREASSGGGGKSSRRNSKASCCRGRSQSGLDSQQGSLPHRPDPGPDSSQPGLVLHLLPTCISASLLR